MYFALSLILCSIIYEIAPLERVVSSAAPATRSVPKSKEKKNVRGCARIRCTNTLHAVTHTLGQWTCQFKSTQSARTRTARHVQYTA